MSKALRGEIKRQICDNLALSRSANLCSLITCLISIATVFQYAIQVVLTGGVGKYSQFDSPIIIDQ